MSKLKITHKNNQICVKSRLGRKEEISERESQIVSKKMIRGLMRLTVEGRKQISYAAPDGITLKQFLQSGISREEFFIVLAQFVEVTKKILKYKLNINNLVLNLQNCFLNERTREIYFIYQPVTSQNIGTDVLSFLYDMIFETVFYLSEDTRFVNDLTDFMNDMSQYSAEKMEKYILYASPETYRHMQREGQAEWSANDSGSLLNNKGYDQGQSKRLRIGREWDEEEKETTLLSEETGLLEEEGTTLLEEEGTTLLNDGMYFLEEDGTTLLKRESVVYPYLVRVSNHDKVEVNKPVFRIGKERSFVDYFVANNNAVSRLHADIIKKGENYYLRDNNSTNHTFVNGVMIDVNQERELYDGDALMFANEAFEFHLR